MKTYYSIDGVNEQFATLYDAKNHLSFYTANDLQQLRNACGGCVTITKVENDVTTCAVPVRIANDGRVTFGKASSLAKVEGVAFVRCISFNEETQHGQDFLIVYANGRAYDCTKDYYMKNGQPSEERYNIRGIYRRSLRAAVLDTLK